MVLSFLRYIRLQCYAYPLTLNGSYFQIDRYRVILLHTLKTIFLHL